VTSCGLRLYGGFSMVILLRTDFLILVMYVFALLLFEPGKVTTRSQGS